MIEEVLKPNLATPFPREMEIWTCPKTGLKVPKHELRNLEYREKILRASESDIGMQNDLMAACAESFLYWINSFVFTYHQFDTEGDTGTRSASEDANVPMITWEVQDDLTGRLEWHLENAKDILINKSREMGASWLCATFMHWLWLFRSDSQLLELSRVEGYVDQPGNMKALFQKHDYINSWLPSWMLPPDCLYGHKNRTKMHLMNVLNHSCIDGESTTKHAASGDRRLVGLLDEFAKVENGTLLRSATRDACLMRIINSTVAGPGTEYSKWKNDGTIVVFPLMWWDHPDKGKNRYVAQEPITKAWKIRSPWYDAEEKVRSKQEMAREIDAQDLEAGSTFFTTENIVKHIVLFGREPKTRWDIDFKRGIANDSIPSLLVKKDLKCLSVARSKDGPLRVWVELVNGRLDQTMDYVFGIDLSKGQGASNSVISIKCKQTNQKVAEWRDANTPPYEMSRISTALAIWVGGRRKLPYKKWEMNGPGWDFGKIVVKEFHYPYYYRNVKAGDIRDKTSRQYGWHASTGSKQELLGAYDRALASGGYVNPSIWGLEEAKTYIWYPDGGIGPAQLVEENQAAKKTHGDVVIADALTIEEKKFGPMKQAEPVAPTKSAAYRRQLVREKKTKKWDRVFDFRK
jgi:hypothetical protein